MELSCRSIGTIHTPYFSLSAPNQPIKDSPGEFWITLDAEYLEALERLESYRYIYVLFYLDKVTTVEKKVTPPWAPEFEVGLFASRSPNRPNPIGLSVVEIKEISGDEIVISGIDVFNGTPLLDIKPYIRTIDCKKDANDGWYDDLADKHHSLAHMLELDHEHPEEGVHVHVHMHPHSHQHTHSHELAHPVSGKASVQRRLKVRYTGAKGSPNDR